jgi:hypothetical protein
VDESTAEIAGEPSKDPHALFMSKVEREQVRGAIQQLSGEFREIILLHEYGELSYQKIATVLGCPAGTVMSRLGRARSNSDHFSPGVCELPIDECRELQNEPLRRTHMSCCPIEEEVQ